jgi:uncharacterized glyoxalase superfamily protein PhnB
MKPRLTALTLGVADLERALAFYRDGLGWPSDGIIGTEFEGGAVAFFNLPNGLLFALYPQQQIAKDANLPVTPASPSSFTLGYNVNSKEEVDTILQEARAAGATILTEGHDMPWGGYLGHFQDSDGHLWEIVWNPQLTVDEGQ